MSDLQSVTSMRIDDPKIVTLRAMVTAAMEEFDWAVRFYEVWKIAADDKDLHARMGTSFATHAFLITRAAIRREMLLALMRLWDVKSKDKAKKNIRMDWIADAVGDRQVIDALALARAENFGHWPGVFEGMRAELDAKAVEVINLVRKYMEGGSHHAARRKLTTLRHQQLAHRQIAATAESAPYENEIEEFYRDSAKLVQVLCSLVNATAFDPEDFAGVYRHYATLFWAGARGEQTEGHPNYPR
ncbi:hypothetical protein HU230_0036830 [Bradyrhizobium quebecense]|uniref:HEPN AbiU2-like domain-containing protein n=1 Tax=Bradyrhizobium quebecense TaxID=2748629 RepID=A0A974ADI9_9BRAD|nr:hypothetical protein [Bradyrhizobium quebecense]UGA43755.1 hypothetical protein HU230_0036830 [Bradyrhizobium quebecense]